MVTAFEVHTHGHEVVPGRDGGARTRGPEPSRPRGGGLPARPAPVHDGERAARLASIGGRPPDPGQGATRLITHDTRCALDLVVDLVNTAPEGDGTDALPDVAALDDFARNHDLSDVGVLSEFDLSAARKIRGRFARSSPPRTPGRGRADQRAGRRGGKTPRLTDHDGYDWHVHYFAPGASVADHIAADCGMALAFFVVAGEQERLRRCEAPDCRRAFVDLSRNRSRRYCDSRTCGNRLHCRLPARRKEAAG